MLGKSVVFVLFCAFFSTVMSVPTPVPEYYVQDYDSQLEEQPNNSLSTALVTIASIIEENHNNLNFDLYPTLHQIIMGPFTLISRTVSDVISHYDQRSIFDILSFTNLRSAVVFLPERVVQYWARLLEMEIQCYLRTICDLSAYISPRIPYWANQLVGVYFTSHSDNNMYYRAVANGMINHNCINYYPKCSQKNFFAGLAGNVSDIIATTLSPLTETMMRSINSQLQ